MLSLATIYPTRAAEFRPTGAEVATNEEIVDRQQEEYEIEATTNAAFIKAARRIVDEDAGNNALSQLKLAEAAAEDARRHYAAGDYAYALEDISESTRMVKYAMILANSDKPSDREQVIKKALLFRASRDHERKEMMIKRRLLEAETFIKTAERLMVEADNKGAKEKTSNAKELLVEARMAIAADDYEIALPKIHLAYDLSTDAVKEIKKAEGAVITFRKPAANNQEELLIYEKRRNKNHLFFANQNASTYGKGQMKMLRRARSLSAQATRAYKARKYDKAINKFNESTKLLLEAYRSNNRD